MAAFFRYSLLLFLLHLLLIPDVAQAQSARTAIITVSTSPESPFHTRLEIREPKSLARQIINSPAMQTSLQPELPRALIQIGTRTCVFDSYSQLFEPAKKTKVFLLLNVRKQLEKWVALAERAHFGKPLDWNEVKKTFHRMSYARVIDMETGESFRVQRRAGSRHADVQPLTREDTATMKRVYAGKWSWKRRAILVEIDGRKYAASMHGMPHGAGAIVGNNFPGHFCIHFQGSSTHKRKEPDPSHNLMILKASGKLKQTLLRADPMQVVDMFLLSLHEQDESTLHMTTDGFPLPFEPSEISELNPLNEDWQNHIPDLLAAEIPVQLRYHEKNGGKQKATWIFHLERPSPISRWKITSIDIDPMKTKRR
ncbi:MAG: hypothetical protein ACM32O_01525 [Clostridia bacterium]